MTPASLFLASLALATLMIGAPAASLNVEPPAVPVAFDGDAKLADARALTDALLSGHAPTALRALADEAGIQVPTLDVVLPSAHNALAALGVDVAALPADLVGPLGDLWAAVDAASALTAQATAALTPGEKALILDGGLFAERVLDADVPLGLAALQLETEPVLTAADHAALLAKVDVGLLVAATLLVLETIDEVLPQFPSYPLSTDGPGGCLGGPPSVLNQPPHLAVDGTSNYLWAADYTLTIDLGGNDCYTNRAGGGLTGVGVALDLGGSDTYTRTSTTAASVGQGAALLGVGVLVDAAGDDTYTATSALTAPQPGPVAPPASVTAQGGAGLGVGALVDLGGRDTFTMTATSSGGSASATGQGGGALGGVGLLLAAGAGTGSSDTTYSATATSTLHLVSSTPSLQTYNIQRGTTTAQGGATLAGAGALADLLGRDTYGATSAGSAGGTTAQGGATGGVGALADATGSDTYNALASGAVTLTLIVSDTGFCWTVTVNVVTDETLTVAHGGANIGAGVFADLGLDGNSLSARASSFARAHAEVLLSASSFCTNSAIATADTGDARVIAQGAGLTGAGVMIGSPGPDGYLVRADSRAEAVALVKHGFVGTNTATASSGNAVTRSHGTALTGVGLALDPRGNDGYSSSGATSASRTTTLLGTVPGTSGVVDLLREGHANIGVGWLLDLDGTDAYSTLPIAGNNKCWTQPTSPVGTQHQARGRDLSPPYVPLPAGCP